MNAKWSSGLDSGRKVILITSRRCKKAQTNLLDNPAYYQPPSRRSMVVHMWLIRLPSLECSSQVQNQHKKTEGTHDIVVCAAKGLRTQTSEKIEQGKTIEACEAMEGNANGKDFRGKGTTINIALRLTMSTHQQQKKSREVGAQRCSI